MSRPAVDRDTELASLEAAFIRLTTWDRVYLARHYPDILQPLERLAIDASFHLVLDD